MAKSTWLHYWKGHHTTPNSDRTARPSTRRDVATMLKNARSRQSAYGREEYRRSVCLDGSKAYAIGETLRMYEEVS